ncbi:VanZ family protein [Allokutzneria albata]|uniref:VanZ like family protein n=1 Tax=Allokutzneria albata TaxID=211114 RepID=A0A1H0B037_ALLAB|nr:VanZ family protein [Allokutzneria albata]SDN39052.1 VanZ like family protein [Allokutzneria albata]
MYILHVRVPITWWTALGLLAGTAVSLLLWRPLAARTGWHPGWSLMSLLLLSSTLALTFGPGLQRSPPTLTQCLPTRATKLLRSLAQLGGDLENVLNLLVLAPVVIAVVLATRRTAYGVWLAIALPGLIEIVQSQIPGRVCSTADYCANAVGGVSAAVLTAAVLRRRRAFPG